jgi:hypothetical protein
MLMNIDKFHEIVAQKVFLWVLMKLLLILFRGEVLYFASKEDLGKVCMFYHVGHDSKCCFSIRSIKTKVFFYFVSQLVAL